MTTWVQEGGQRFLSTRLSADKFPCTTGRQSHRYIKKHFDQFNVYRLLYFPTQISSLVGTSAQIDWALQWTKSSSTWGWCKFLVSHLSAHSIVFELVTLNCTVNESSPGFTTHTAGGKVIIPTKFANSCKQSSIKSWKCTVIISFPWTSLPLNNAHLTAIENDAFA